MNMKTQRVLLVSILGLLALAAPACIKDDNTKATLDKMAADKAAAVKAAEDKAAADIAAANKSAADRAAADKAALEKSNDATAAAMKASAEKDAEVAKLRAELDKASADKAAAEKAAADKKTLVATLPKDLLAMKSEIAAAVMQIDLTMAKLDVLADTTGDLAKPSQDCLDAIKALTSNVADVKKRSTDMRERGAAYFDNWEKQLAEMSTPEIVALATKRKNELAAKYAEVLNTMQASRAAFDPFWAEIESIQKSLDDGVTAESMKALTPHIKSAKEKAATLKTRIESTSTQLNQLGGIYTTP